MGYLSAVKDISPGLGCLCRKELGAWAEEYLTALSDKGLKFSTLANVGLHLP
jgi:hypothetical protein